MAFSVRGNGRCPIRHVEPEVVVYDRLVGPGILAMANPAAELVYVGKERARHFMRQTEINAG